MDLIEADDNRQVQKIFKRYLVDEYQDEERIVSKLTEYYNDLKQITDAIK